MSTGPTTPQNRVDIHVHRTRTHANLMGNRFKLGALRDMQVGEDTATWWT